MNSLEKTLSLSNKPGWFTGVRVPGWPYLPAGLRKRREIMEKNYTVSVYVSETQTDTFTIKAPDLETAQRDAMIEAVERKYDIEDVINVVETEEDTSNENRKSEVEKAARNFLYKQITEKCGGKCSNPEDYITGFAWVGNCLYASIDQLQNPTLIATMEEGVVV